MTYTPLPIGIDDKKMKDNGYYYVDKTWMIKEFLDKKGKVNLFTRPHCFGKTLNMSMLKREICSEIVNMMLEGHN